MCVWKLCKKYFRNPWNLCIWLFWNYVIFQIFLHHLNFGLKIQQLLEVEEMTTVRHIRYDCRIIWIHCWVSTVWPKHQIQHRLYKTCHYFQQVTHQHINHLVFLHFFYFCDVFFQVSIFCKKWKNTSHNYVFSSNLWKLIFWTKHIGCYLTTEFSLLKYHDTQYLVKKKKHSKIWAVIPILWRLLKCENLSKYHQITSVYASHVTLWLAHSEPWRFHG